MSDLVTELRKAANAVFLVCEERPANDLSTILRSAADTIAAYEAKKSFLVRYDGSYLGGRAVVWANDEKEALDLVRNHSKTCNFDERATATLVEDPNVLYNWDGDY